MDDSFCTTSVVTGEPIDLSSTLFVDDTAKRVAGSTLGEVKAKAERVESKLRDVAQSAGVALNMDKKVSVVHLCGRNAVVQARKLNQQFVATGSTEMGVIAREARYLGPVIHHMECFFPERARRIEAASRAFRIFGSFWTSNAGKPIRVLIFRAVVVTTLFSAITAFFPGQD